MYSILAVWNRSQQTQNIFMTFVYGKDRKHTVQHKRGGGILMAFKKVIISRRPADLETDCEIMVCNMQVSNYRV